MMADFFDIFAILLAGAFVVLGGITGSAVLLAWLDRRYGMFASIPACVVLFCAFLAGVFVASKP